LEPLRGQLVHEGKSGASLIIESPRGERYKHALKFMFKASNNEAEYKVLIAGVDLCYTASANAV